MKALSAQMKSAENAEREPRRSQRRNAGHRGEETRIVADDKGRKEGGFMKALQWPLIIAMVSLAVGGAAAVAESGRDLDERSFRRPSQPITIRATELGRRVSLQSGSPSPEEYRLVVDELRTRGIIRTESRPIRGGQWPTQSPTPVTAQPGFDPARRGIVPLSTPATGRLGLNPTLQSGANRRPEIRERDLRR